MKIQEFNTLPENEALLNLLECCTSSRLAELLCVARPFDDKTQLLAAAQFAWQHMQEDDFLEALELFKSQTHDDETAHACNDLKTPAMYLNKPDATKNQSLCKELAQLSRAYEKRFGFVLAAFASADTPEQMLTLLKSRLKNTREQELANAAQTQEQIATMRLSNMIH